MADHESESQQVGSTPASSSTGTSCKDPTKMSTKERLRRLQAICKPGQTPLVPRDRRKSWTKKRRVEHLDSEHGKRFACSAGSGIDACLRRWMQHGTRVHVKLRASSAQQEPNRLLQGAIVAFDKHWNMVLRDVDEVYVPPNRLGKVPSKLLLKEPKTRSDCLGLKVFTQLKWSIPAAKGIFFQVQAMPGAMPSSVRYMEDKLAAKCQRRMLTRHLKCSLITGSSLIAIYSGDAR